MKLIELVKNNRYTLKKDECFIQLCTGEIIKVGSIPKVTNQGITLEKTDLPTIIETYTSFGLCEDYKTSFVSYYDLHPSKKTDSAHDVLQRAADLLKARGIEYEKDGEQERSMENIVKAFNAVTSHKLSTADGWAFMQCLKLVRAFKNPTHVHRDSLEDNVSYAALLAEEMLKNVQE